MPGNSAASIGEKVVGSSLWMGSWRWSARLIGFGTTVILARLLLPEDFGIVATGAIVVGFFTIMLDLGTDKYLIRHENPDRADYDTAWTLRLIVITVASIAIFFAAQPGANYFGDQRLVDVIRLLAVAGWLNGFTNIGLTKYRRELQFRIIAIIGLSQRLVATVTTIALAVWLRSYWAMIMGEMVFMLAGLVLSYTQHEYRPRLTLLRARRQWEFCKWILLQNLATFMQGQGDSFVVVKFFGIEWMGIYSMAMRIAALPTRQIIMPVLPPVYSGMAKKQHDPDLFVASALKVIGATASLMLPAATLFAVLSEELVTVVLGERWMLAIPIVTALIFSVLLAVLTNPAATVLTIKGKVKLLAGLNWLSAVMVVFVLLMVAQWYEIDTLVWARTGVTFILLLLYYRMLMLAIDVSAGALIGCIYRPFFASLVMALVIYQVASMVGSAWLVIFSGIILGGAAYLIVAALLWRLAGSPDSGEALLVRKLGKIITRTLENRVNPKM